MVTLPRTLRDAIDRKLMCFRCDMLSFADVQSDQLCAKNVRAGAPVDLMMPVVFSDVFDRGLIKANRCATEHRRVKYGLTSFELPADHLSLVSATSFSKDYNYEGMYQNRWMGVRTCTSFHARTARAWPALAGSKPSQAPFICTGTNLRLEQQHSETREGCKLKLGWPQSREAPQKTNVNVCVRAFGSFFSIKRNCFSSSGHPQTRKFRKIATTEVTLQSEHRAELLSTV